MQASNAPSKSAVPFANSGTKNSIPVASQIGVTPGLASFTDGFPPLTMTPLAAGGVPPYGADFNGILNFLSAAIRWIQAGGGYPFDAAFSAAIGGYPKGANVLQASGNGYWLNQIDNNTSNPDTGGANWIALPTAAVGPGYMLVTQETAAGVAAGASVAGTLSVRALNTVRSNTIQGASLSSSQLTLPAGTYRISASAPANGVNLHALRLYNVSDSANAILGTSENTTSFAATPGETTVTRSFVQGRLVLTAQKIFELRHYCQETVSSGLGSPANAGGAEVYAMIEIIKES